MSACPAPRSRRADIVGRRNWFFLISLIIIIPGIISMVTRGFLLGIDFAGGTEFLVKFENRPSLQAVEATIARDNINGYVQQTADGSFVIRATTLTPVQQQRIKDDLQKTGGPITQYTADSVGAAEAPEIV